MTSQPGRYRFGPLERRGLVGSLRVPQVLILGVALVAGVVSMRAAPTGAGVVAAVVVVGVALVTCFWPVLGRSVEEWAPVVLRHGWIRARSRNLHRSSAVTSGVRVRT